MTKEKKPGIMVSIDVPERVVAKLEANQLILKGPKGENKKKMDMPNLKIEVNDKKIVLRTSKNSKKEKKTIYTYNAHIKNWISGVLDGHNYTLKVCASHFPMSVSIVNNQIIIKNFIGEKYPRTLLIKPGVNVKVEGDKIHVDSFDKELAGTMASEIERLTKRPRFDPRIFQDGIYIINKNGKDIK
jgi:large subunit ribosomal protein L6